MAELFRGMKQDVDGKPVVEPTKRGLGVKVGSVRPEEDDIPVNEMGSVQPSEGGMSVSADSPGHLPRSRKPPKWGGQGKDPIWVIDEDLLPPELIAVYDGSPNRSHRCLEPAAVMQLEDYQAALASTRENWKLCE